ncbi:MAG: DbpA RNA binding domain-containing protein [Gemmatimonadetes bacterium]|nr:DbpA RNA binding domain-containing protein [Gemmatimonadota bacterium]
MSPPTRRKRGTSDPQVPEIVAALAPAVDRGHHIALLVGEGGGAATLYAHAAARDLEEAGDEGRVFVLSPTPDRVLRCARAVAATPVAGPFETLALTRDSAPGIAELTGARIICSTPVLLLGAVRTGDLAATDIRTVILDGVGSLRDEWAAVEAILQSAEGARRVAAAHGRDEAFEDLLVRQLPRARRWPAELFDEASESAGRADEIRVATAATYAGRVAHLTRLIHGLAEDGGGSVFVYVADPDRIDDVEVALTVEGFQIAGDETDAGVRIGGPGDAPDPAEVAIALGLPSDPLALTGGLAGAGKRFAIVHPLHERQLELLGARSGWRTVPMGGADLGELHDDVDAFRARVSDAVARLDLTANGLLLAPLLEEHGADRVAAALAGLLRSKAPSDGDAADDAISAPAERVTRPTWTRVYVGVGKRDGARPGDLVGAITGETGAAGGQIGRIDVRQGFTLVDVDSLVADDVVKGLDGARIKGRQVVARFDRDRRPPK